MRLRQFLQRLKRRYLDSSFTLSLDGRMNEAGSGDSRAFATEFQALEHIVRGPFLCPLP